MSELPTSIIPDAPSIVGYIEERVDFPEFSEDGPSTTQTAGTSVTITFNWHDTHHIDRAGARGDCIHH